MATTAEGEEGTDDIQMTAEVSEGVVVLGGEGVRQGEETGVDLGADVGG